MSKNVIKMKLPYINNNNSLTILMEWKIAVISNIQHHCIAPANNNNNCKPKFIVWRCRGFYSCIFLYAQALHIDWAVFQNCPINVKIFQYFFGHFENCPINVRNYPINVKCLRTPPVQAFHIDWVVFKFLAIFGIFWKITQSMWNACTGGVRKHFTLIG